MRKVERPFAARPVVPARENRAVTSKRGEPANPCVTLLRGGGGHEARRAVRRRPEPGVPRPVGLSTRKPPERGHSSRLRASAGRVAGRPARLRRGSRSLRLLLLVATQPQFWRRGFQPRHFGRRWAGGGRRTCSPPAGGRVVAAGASAPASREPTRPSTKPGPHEPNLHFPSPQGRSRTSPSTQRPRLWPPHVIIATSGVRGTAELYPNWRIVRGEPLGATGGLRRGVAPPARPRAAPARLSLRQIPPRGTVSCCGIVYGFPAAEDPGGYTPARERRPSASNREPNRIIRMHAEPGPQSLARRAAAPGGPIDAAKSPSLAGESA